MKTCDTLVLGADLEGLAAAAHLARGGRRVLVVDGRPVAGGAAAREEFHPGYRASLFLGAGGARRALLAPLALERHGLAWHERGPSLLLLGDGTSARWSSDAGRSAAELVRDDPREAQALERWRAFHARIAPLVAEVLDDAPPALAAPEPAELLRLALRGWHLRRLGEADIHTLLRALTLPAADWTYQWFASDELRVAATASALAGSRLGPRAAGTAALSLLGNTAFGPEPRGGPAALADALLAACRALGVELALGDEPRRLLTDGDGVSGLECASARHEARWILSCLGPRRTRALCDPRQAPRPLVHGAERWRERGALSVLQVALDHVPRFGEAEDVERVLLVRSLEQLERSADALKYGALPEEPWLELSLEAGTGTPGGPAPEGHAVLTAHVHGTCHGLRGGWTPEARQRLTGLSWKAIEGALPGLRARSRAHRLITPDELEQRYGLPGGHLWGGELALDQLWVQRPSLALSRYAAGVPGLFLGGASQHPGGPFHGAAGSLAARALLQAARGKRG